MSGSNTPASGKQEKIMSSRLLTMKFMQRAAASDSKRSPSTPTHLPANFPRELNGQSAKRRKLSPSAPQSPDPVVVSTPGSLYQSDGSRTPLPPQPQERSKSFTPLNYGGNTAETPWVLNIITPDPAVVTREQQQGQGQGQEQEQPISPQEETSPQEPVLGRRTFGNFKKKTATTTTTTTTAKASPKHKDKDEDNDNDNDSLSSGEPDEDYEQYGERTHSRQPPPSSNAERSRGKRRKDQDDDDRRDTINLKKLKSGGISAAAGMRQPGFDARKYKRGKRKG